MYKKLSTNFIITSTVIMITLALSVIFSSIQFQLTGIFSNSVFASLFTNISSFFSLDMVDNNVSTVKTEIVARRIGSGLATSGLGGVGTGIGLVFSGLIKGFSRNPSLKDDLFSYAIFGFALTEAIGLFALMMAFMLLYA
jgi:F-type H+-transporting ATPase subunit c